ncbi:sigma-54 interaction domain-containing protein [Piscinibacter gummiphilus]|uniref:Sigma 54-interacting transcriptional regulator n=1 Tax=Piscinibacter gummiphilus TaxID=946333 RepID=A0ABZ0CRH7_9BURK|nr:sigma 54-interacting transcriptional regulator [Piscinibacter gummiphilus]WOB07597.1 sigma 54-interacting transcriptional regulator [Piscinibacter gummiphilus]
MTTTTLPADADGVLKLAAQSMFDTLAQAAMGMMVVDRQHRIVWISEGYKRFLPGLGHEEGDFVGRLVEEVVPNTLMAHVIETGQPMLVDLLTNQAGTFLVSRMPLRDADGGVIGALGLVLLDHPETTMQPLMTKFSRLQRELDDARQQLAAQRRPKYTIASFIGSSPVAMETKRQARRVAQTDSTVLLLGETGTGKELLAHAIHAASTRASRAFVGVNIAAVPDTLLEAEFFGVAPGAYTGADRKGRDGKFKLADGGTLFLDEIGDMPVALQSKLLRVLQEQEIEPLGSNKVERVDVRIIAATSRDLPAMVAAGSFRADLYYRLNVLPIRLPALRERLPDLEALVEALADDIARRSGLPHKGLSPDALELLSRQAWPGNIRELRNVLEQATLMTDDTVLTAAHFSSLVDGVPQLSPPPLPAAAAPRAPVADAAAATAAIKPLPQAIAELEQRAIREALEATGGNKLAASRLLGISRATLYEKLGSS